VLQFVGDRLVSQLVSWSPLWGLWFSWWRFFISRYLACRNKCGINCIQWNL